MKIKFLSKVSGDVFRLDKRAHVRLDEPLVCQVDDELVIVPAGFVSDFASIPRIFWTLIGSPADFPEPAVLHDYMCRVGEGLKRRGLGYQYSWQEVHEIFRLALIEIGVNPVTTRIMWSAVYGNWLLRPDKRWKKL